MAIDTTTAIQNNTTTQTSTSKSDTQAASSAASLDYTAFLNLLIAQMKNQDPTDPADPAEWMGQIASFSNVEQSIQTNAKLDALMTSISVGQSEGLIGRTIYSPDTGITGTIAAVQVITGGSLAILTDGSEVMLGDGVIIA